MIYKSEHHLNKCFLPILQSSPENSELRHLYKQALVLHVLFPAYPWRLNCLGCVLPRSVCAGCCVTSCVCLGRGNSFRLLTSRGGAAGERGRTFPLGSASQIFCLRLLIRIFLLCIYDHLGFAFAKTSAADVGFGHEETTVDVGGIGFHR